jgi:hypothetical protein
MKKDVLLVFCLFFVVVFSLFASAVCSSDSQAMFSLYQEDNSHVSRWDNLDYTIKACYDDIFGSIGNGDRTCNEDYSNVFSISILNIILMFLSLAVNITTFLFVIQMFLPFYRH